jgi:hypothetical protein
MKIKRGEYKIIRVDGTETIVKEHPQIKAIHRAIGCECLDTVVLTMNPVSGLPDTVMMVDDTGMIDGKPINAKATFLYHSVCRPGTPYSIHGDVAIVNDSDFETIYERLQD